ncbi:hypothetical protein DM01DRAFT_1379606 [Hesseltinella vesiculosa]|uniref:Uncharacterized protein n=1 Tax=Hesseltinella vesiculosa TaxID=101127 RepID=A0A1X2GY85_9FUNG|nr:hypothetical protein DM01DRAFT_1379606 [Hesseltinella vesiculosa]
MLTAYPSFHSHFSRKRACHDDVTWNKRQKRSQLYECSRPAPLPMPAPIQHHSSPPAYKEPNASLSMHQDTLMTCQDQDEPACAGPQLPDIRQLLSPGASFAPAMVNGHMLMMEKRHDGQLCIPQAVLRVPIQRSPPSWKSMQPVDWMDVD